jgi:glutaredoxin
MITLYRTKSCPGCQAIEETLKELCLAHKVVIVRGPEGLPKLPDNGASPPLLIDDGQAIQGSRNIIEHLNELEEFKKLWEKFQSDVCYCDENGNNIV